MLGKRKRNTEIVSKPIQNTEYSNNPTTETAESTRNIFRRHFEAIFEPLPEQNIKVTNGVNSDSDESSDNRSEVSEWSGLSETSTQPSLQPQVIEVVDHTVLEADGGTGEFHRAKQKAFMSSRPPREASDTSATTTATRHGTKKKPLEPSDGNDDNDDFTEKLNLKHDLDLQRLLRESHLLERSRAAAATPGRGRQLALDMRLQTLGAKESIYTQRNMPRSHRIGINKKAESREALRRKEAKENGIVLEKASALKQKRGVAAGKERRRVRGVDVPGVGKFSGGTLKLSRSDVASIQGIRSSPGSVTGRRKGRRS